MWPRKKFLVSTVGVRLVINVGTCFPSPVSNKSLHRQRAQQEVMNFQQQTEACNISTQWYRDLCWLWLPKNIVNDDTRGNYYCVIFAPSCTVKKLRIPSETNLKISLDSFVLGEAISSCSMKPCKTFNGLFPPPSNINVQIESFFFQWSCLLVDCNDYSQLSGTIVLNHWMKIEVVQQTGFTIDIVNKLWQCLTCKSKTKIANEWRIEKKYLLSCRQ